jgi:hypothetical protein
MENADEPRGCTCRNSCAMFSQFDTADRLDYWRQRYCYADYGECARYKQIEAGETPSEELLPSGRLLRLP